jgi:hypothetical protein
MPFTVCTDLDPQVCYSDDFNRANNLNLGANWEQFLDPFGSTNQFSIVGNQLRTYNDNTAVPECRGGWWTAFPLLATHQSSRLIFKSNAQVTPPTGPLPGQITINGGGPCVRMNEVSAARIWDNGIICYQLRYQEQRSRISPFPLLQAELWLDWQGAAGLVNLDVEIIPQLSAGDEVKVTAMNYTDPLAGASVCLKGYVNDVLILSKVITSLQATYIETGRAGIGCSVEGGYPWYAIDWDDWQGCTMDIVEVVPVDECNCASILEVERDCAMTARGERDCSFTQRAEC